MLPKQRRLRTAAEFDQVFDGSRARNGTLLSVRQTGTGPARYGFIVGKRVSLQATKRNRLKRQLRALAATSPAKGDIVVIAHPPAKEAAYTELAAELRRLLKSIS